MALWWQTGVVYQIYPRSFMDSNNDGVGDLQGVLHRLDYLQWLGIDAIWFSPLFPSPMADFGYDVANYTDIHHEYGTLADFETLLKAAHQRNIKILLDLVPNHTSSEHPWFIESRSSRDNPKRDWYIWKDAKPDGSPPNNWVAYFGGPAWTFDEQTGQYYMHNFVSGQPELNWRNPAVSQAMFQVITFWLGKGVDGFRIDVIDRILKDPEFRDNPQDANWKDGDNPVWRFKRIHSEQAPGTHEYMKLFREVFDEFPNTVSIGEVAYDLTPEGLGAFYGTPRTDGSGDELHLPFNFRLIPMPWNAEAFRRDIDAYDAAIPAHGTPNYVLSNHDMPRLASKVGGLGQARIAAMLLLTLRGTPTLYYGDEIGMTNVPIPPDQILDPQGRNTPGFNRDECRTPMQWNDSPNAGFSAEGVHTWLPTAENYQQVNVEAEKADPDSLLWLYQRLLTYRRQSDVLLHGTYQSLDAPEGCYVYMRQYNDKRCLIALNFTHEEKTLMLQRFDSGKIAISTQNQRDGEVVNPGQLHLAGDEGMIIEL